MSGHQIRMTVNGQVHTRTVAPRMTLSDHLREDLGLTGVHVGCEHGICGACTIIVDGRAVRSCLMLAAQADGSNVTTLEGLAAADGTLHPVQESLRKAYGLQCGFCTPGIAMTLAAMTADAKAPDADTLIAALSGHLCRCTGYQGVRRAAVQIAKDAAAANLEPSS